MMLDLALGVAALLVAGPVLLIPVLLIPVLPLGRCPGTCPLLGSTYYQLSAKLIHR